MSKRQLTRARVATVAEFADFIAQMPSQTWARVTAAHRNRAWASVEIRPAATGRTIYPLGIDGRRGDLRRKTSRPATLDAADIAGIGEVVARSEAMHLRARTAFESPEGRRLTRTGPEGAEEGSCRG